MALASFICQEGDSGFLQGNLGSLLDFSTVLCGSSESPHSLSLYYLSFQTSGLRNPENETRPSIDQQQSWHRRRISIFKGFMHNANKGQNWAEVSSIDRNVGVKSRVLCRQKYSKLDRSIAIGSDQDSCSVGSAEGYPDAREILEEYWGFGSHTSRLRVRVWLSQGEAGRRKVSVQEGWTRLAHQEHGVAQGNVKRRAGGADRFSSPARQQETVALFTVRPPPWGKILPYICARWGLGARLKRLRCLVVVEGRISCLV